MITATNREIVQHKGIEYLVEIIKNETSYKTIISKDFEGKAILMHSSNSGLESNKTALIEKAREYIIKNFK